MSLQEILKTIVKTKIEDYISVKNYNLKYDLSYIRRSIYPVSMPEGTYTSTLIELKGGWHSIHLVFKNKVHDDIVLSYKPELKEMHPNWELYDMGIDNKIRFRS